jgi:hypothetical protein
MVKCPELWNLVKECIRSAKQLHVPEGQAVQASSAAAAAAASAPILRSFEDPGSCFIRGRRPEVLIIDFPLLVMLIANGADTQYKHQQARDEIQAMELELKDTDDPAAKTWEKANKDAVLQLKAEIASTKDDPKAPTLLTLASRIVRILAKFARLNPTIKNIIIRADTHSPKQKETTQKNRREAAAKAQARAEEKGQKKLPPYDEKDYYVDIPTCQLIERSSGKIVKPVEFGRLAMNRREIMHNFIAAIVKQLEKEPLDDCYFPWSRQDLPQGVVWTFDYAQIETVETEVFVPFEEIGRNGACIALDVQADHKSESDMEDTNEWIFGGQNKRRDGVAVEMSDETLKGIYNKLRPSSKKCIVKIKPICHDVHVGTGVYPNDLGPVRAHGEADPAIVKWVELLEDKNCVVVSRDGDVLVILAMMMERRMRQQYGPPRKEYGTWTTQQWHESDLPSIYWFRNGRGPLDVSMVDGNSMYNMNEAMMRLHEKNWTAKRLFLASFLTKNDFFLDKQLVLPSIGPDHIAAIVKCYSDVQLQEVIDHVAGLQVLIGRIWVHKLALKLLDPPRDAPMVATQTWDAVKSLIRQATNQKGDRWDDSWCKYVTKIDKMTPFHQLLKDNWIYWSLVDDKHPFQPNKDKVQVVD